MNKKDNKIESKYFCMDWITRYPITIFTIAYDKHVLKYLLNWKWPLNGQKCYCFSMNLFVMFLWFFIKTVFFFLYSEDMVSKFESKA